MSETRRVSTQDLLALKRRNNADQELPKTRMANCGSCFWCIIWLVVLLVIGWPLGITLGGLYGLISPLTTCLGLDRLSDLLLEGANLGRTCANNMRHCKPLC